MAEDEKPTAQPEESVSAAQSLAAADVAPSKPQEPAAVEVPNADEIAPKAAEPKEQAAAEPATEAEPEAKPEPAAEADADAEVAEAGAEDDADAAEPEAEADAEPEPAPKAAEPEPEPAAEEPAKVEVPAAEPAAEPASKPAPAAADPAPAPAAAPEQQPAPAAETAPAPAEQEPAKKSRKGLVIGLLALVVAAIVAVVVVVNPFGQGGDDFYDSGMTLGSYEGKTEEEILADLNAQVAENEMSISCAPNFEVDSKTGEAQVRIENIAANHVDQKFTIELEDGTMLYESGGIQPGYYVQSVQLDKVPEPGEYTCIVTFQGYDPKTHHAKGGSAALNVPMTVS